MGAALITLNVVLTTVLVVVVTGVFLAVSAVLWVALTGAVEEMGKEADVPAEQEFPDRQGWTS